MLGWAPRSTQVGDKVCIFSGARAPFIVRPNQDGSYGLIGDAYIHGMMYGEAMDWDMAEWENIHIT
jgi:hypothetical protein